MTYQAILLQAERASRRPSRPGAAGNYREPRLSLVERQPPRLLTGQVLLEVCSVSICGTDVHALQTDADGFSCSSVPAANWESGIQFGHEMAARIAATGPGVNGFAVGDYVTSDSLVPCRRADCRTCRSGQWNACPRAYLLGLQADGMFGELAVAPATSVHSIAPLIDAYGLVRGLMFASLAEPLAVALQAYSQAYRWLGQRRPHVLVLGAGMIGLFLAWKARLAGADWIEVAEPKSDRAEISRVFADAVMHPADLNLKCHQRSLDDGPDVIFDACGQADVKAVLQGLAPGGCLVTAARTGQQICFSGDGVITSGQAIVGTRGHVGHVPDAVQMLTQSKLDPEMFLTRSLDGLSQLHAELQNPQRLTDELKISCKIANPCRGLRRC